MSGLKRAGIAAVAVVIGLGLAGCAAGVGPSVNYAGGPTEVSESDLIGESQAFYVSDAGAIAVVLWGSSTCPTVGERMVVEKSADEGNVVRVDTREIPENTPCTMDLVPHTTVFPTPNEVTTTETLTIHVGDATLEIENVVGEGGGEESGH